MIRFIFTGGARTFEHLIDVEDSRQRSHLEFMATNILSSVGTLDCLQHPGNASAVIILDCTADKWSWSLVTSCCPEYGKLLESKIADIYPRRQG